MIKIYGDDKVEVRYTHVVYPDSQQSAIIDVDTLPKKPNFNINARLSDFRQVELLLAVVSAIKSVVPSCKINLNIAYLLGARSDRQFGPGSPNYLRDVIAPVINALNLTSISILDPHSYVSEAVFKKSRALRVSHVLLSRYVDDLKFEQTGSVEQTNTIQIVIPDAGAEPRIFNAIKLFRESSVFFRDVEFKFIQCAKKRNDEGVIESLEILTKDYQFDLPTVVIDDLCDGGRTFMEIAKNLNVKAISLIVTHGVFSKGLNPILAEYDKVYTTNSFQEFKENPNLDVTKVI